jgi:hypothetical protein
MNMSREKILKENKIICVNKSPTQWSHIVVKYQMCMASKKEGGRENRRAR